MNLKSLSKSSNQWLLGLVVAVTAITGAIVLIGMEEFGLTSKNSSGPVKTVPVVVGWVVRAGWHLALALRSRSVPKENPTMA
jgi:hypothetical protein